MMPLLSHLVVNSMSRNILTQLNKKSARYHSLYKDMNLRCCDNLL
ncbi:hypothetical protein BDE27_1102 [Xenorhabdus ehlersii]|uniref:Transposase n=1 Tax=Xenorhabdus ehlersii TaxID=290111 RepID=A0ABX9PM05_9GAMM|nr:hypothetical protein [Xenorhabdus sp. TS4]RKE93365.1 hypothetical protein BDE27_1102 [Xenorhabdus ehlersii]